MNKIKQIVRDIRKQDEYFKINLLLFSFNWVALLTFVIMSLSAHVFPIKFFAIIFIIVAIIYAAFGYMLFNKNQYNLTRKIARILSVIVSVILVVFSFYLNAVNHFFKEIQIDNSDNVTYSLITLRNSKYASVSLIQYIRSPIGIVSDKNTAIVEEEFNTRKQEKLDDELHLAKAIDNHKVQDILEELSNYQQEYVEEPSPGALIEDLLNEKVPLGCIERSYIDLMSEEIDGFEDEFKIIYDFDVNIDETDPDLDDKNVEDLRSEPFVVYINGIDKFNQNATYTSVHGRSEINILLVINPLTNKVIVVNVPSDYYVQIADTTGLRDRLSNIGVYGIQKSIKTMEDLFGININYYFQFNFEDIAPLVDAIEGITIYSDTSFQIEDNGGLSIHIGENLLNGEQALAYARESRNLSDDGDNHDDTKQQVLDAIIVKITSSNVLFRNFSPILMEADKAFRTDMTTDELASLVRIQLESNPEWDVEVLDIDGNEDNLPTFTLGNDYPLRVILPDDSTLNEAKNKIRDNLKGGM